MVLAASAKVRFGGRAEKECGSLTRYHLDHRVQKRGGRLGQSGFTRKMTGEPFQQLDVLLSLIKLALGLFFSLSYPFQGLAQLFDLLFADSISDVLGGQTTGTKDGAQQQGSKSTFVRLFVACSFAVL